MTFRRASVSDALYVGPRLRTADVVELVALGRRGDMALHLCGWVRDLRGPREGVYAGCVGGRPAALFGVADTEDPGAGAVFLVGTPVLDTLPRRTVREARAWLPRLGRGYSVLRNLAHERNRLHVRWLRLLGFETRAPVEYNGHPFVPFSRYV